jgi:hypothetical protein
LNAITQFLAPGGRPLRRARASRADTPRRRSVRLLHTRRRVNEFFGVQCGKMTAQTVRPPIQRSNFSLFVAMLLPRCGIVRFGGMQGLASFCAGVLGCLSQSVCRSPSGFAGRRARLAQQLHSRGQEFSLGQVLEQSPSYPAVMRGEPSDRQNRRHRKFNVERSNQAQRAAILFSATDPAVVVSSIVNRGSGLIYGRITWLTQCETLTKWLTQGKMLAKWTRFIPRSPHHLGRLEAL